MGSARTKPKGSSAHTGAYRLIIAPDCTMMSSGKYMNSYRPTPTTRCCQA